MADPFQISESHEVDVQLWADVVALLPQLSSSHPAMTLEHLREIVGSPATVFLVARGSEDRLLGMLTLALFRVPTGVRAWIEDVVVHDDCRGTGVGSALVREALDRASHAGARTIDLTSRPARSEANRLYQRLGFVARQTNVYRYTLVDPD